MEKRKQDGPLGFSPETFDSLQHRKISFPWSVLFHALSLCNPDPPPDGALRDKSVHQTCFTKPRFARDEDDLAVASHGLLEPAVELGELRFTAYHTSFQFLVSGCWLLAIDAS